MFLILLYFFLHLKMKTEGIFFYFCIGYICGLLLLDPGQCFPANSRKTTRLQPHKSISTFSSTILGNVYSKQTSLSLMDITAFIDQYAVSSSLSSTTQNQTRRSKRSLRANSAEIDFAHSDSLLNHKIVVEENYKASKAEPKNLHPHLDVRQQNLNHDDRLDHSAPQEPAILTPASELDSSQGYEQSVANPESNHGTPQYMLDLFARFENDPFSQPASNIVRSFFNEG